VAEPAGGTLGTFIGGNYDEIAKAVTRGYNLGHDGPPIFIGDNCFPDYILTRKKIQKKRLDIVWRLAVECIKCGICETRCPFGVKVRENMEKAKSVFGY
jgi:Fe-S oxidoreductase